MGNLDDRSFERRVALITGAAAGIGAAVAERLAVAGATLVLCDRDAASLRGVEDRISATGAQVRAFALDVRDRDAVDHMFDEVSAAFDGLDVLINNAGGTFSTPFDQMSVNGEHAIITENFTSVTHCIRRAIGLMDGRDASIVNLTSIEAHRGAPGVAVYAAMKAAVASLTKSLALELAPRRIRINCVAPDNINTEGAMALGAAMEAVSEDAWFLQPWPDEGTVGDAAEVIAFLAGPASRFVTGTTIHADGGTWAAGGWKRHRRGIYVV